MDNKKKKLIIAFTRGPTKSVRKYTRPHKLSQRYLPSYYILMDKGELIVSRMLVKWRVTKSGIK